MPKTSFYSGTGITSEKADAVESSANAAAQSAANAVTSETNAAASEANALTSETNAAASETNAAASETNAAASETNAAASETNAADSETNALASATSAQNLEITSASFDATDGTLTLTKANSGTVTTDLDGRYAELTGATFTGDVTAKSKLIVNKQPIASDLLTTSRSIQDLADWHVYVGTSSNYALTPEKYKDALDVNQDNKFSSSDNYALLQFVVDNYTPGEASTYQSLANNPSNITSTFVQDVLDGDYDSLSTSAGVTIDMDASSIVTVNGDIAVSGTVDGRDLLADGLTVDTDTLHVDATNNRVGIGTTSPSTNLHVAGGNSGTNQALFRTSSEGGGGLQIVCSDLSVANPLWSINTFYGEALAFGDGTSERMRIDSSGNVGIGTSSPNDKFHVANGSTGAGYLRIANNEGYARLGTDGGNLLLDVGGSEAMRIDSSGNVGIGTTSPDTLLHLSDNLGNAVIRLERNDTSIVSGNQIGAIEFEGKDANQGASGVRASIRAEGSASLGQTELVFSTATNNAPESERLRIDSSGKVGIGTSSPTQALDVVGNIAVSGTVDGVDVATLNSNAVVDGDFTTAGIMTTDGSGGYSVDTNTYLTTHQDITGKADLSGATFTGNVTIGIPPSGTQSLTVAGATNLYGGADLQDTNITDVHTLTAKNVDISTSGSVTTNIATGSIQNLGDTKTVNIGTGFSSQGTTTVNIGPSTGNVQLNGTVNLNSNTTFGGNIVFTNSSHLMTVDGRDVSVDGAKLDTLERVYRTRFRHRNSELSTFQSLSITIADIGNPIYTKSTTGSENTLDFFLATTCSDYYDNNDGSIEVVVTAPNPSYEDVVNLGTVSNVVQNIPQGQYNFDVVGDVTKHLTDYCGLSVNSDGSNAFLYGQVRSNAYYNPSTNKTTISCTQYQANKPVNGDTVYLHPFDWETSGTAIIGNRIQIDEVVYNTQKMSRKDFSAYLGYFKSSVTVKIRGKEASSTSDNIAIRKMEGTLTQVQD